MSKKWFVVRLNDGRFVVAINGLTGVEYAMAPGGRTSFEHMADAERFSAQLNGDPMLPEKCDLDTFEKITSHVPMEKATKSALKCVLVHGGTWKAASKAFGITESGILRAMRRVAARNHI